MNDQAAEYWGAKYLDPSFHRAEWQAHPHSLARLAAIQGGVDRDVWFAQNYLKGTPARRALGIGSGTAQTELSMIERGYVEHFDLFDVSPIGIEHAKATAEKAGYGHRVTTHCTDFAAAKIEPGSYDLVVFVASLHHMSDIEGALRAANAALKPNGWLWGANEYVGPDRFNFPEAHVRYVRHFFRSIPRRFRKLDDLMFPTPEEVAAADPSESIHSSQIISTMRRLFPYLDILDLYGSFAFIIFWGINPDAIYESEEGADIVNMILGLDRGMVECGILPGYFAHLVAHKTTPLQERFIRAGLHPNGIPYRALRRIRDTMLGR